MVSVSCVTSSVSQRVQSAGDFSPRGISPFTPGVLLAQLLVLFDCTHRPPRQVIADGNLGLVLVSDLIGEAGIPRGTAIRKAYPPTCRLSGLAGCPFVAVSWVPVLQGQEEKQNLDKVVAGDKAADATGERVGETERVSIDVPFPALALVCQALTKLVARDGEHEVA